MKAYSLIDQFSQLHKRERQSNNIKENTHIIIVAAVRHGEGPAAGGGYECYRDETTHGCVRRSARSPTEPTALSASSSSASSFFFFFSHSRSHHAVYINLALSPHPAARVYPTTDAGCQRGPTFI